MSTTAALRFARARRSPTNTEGESARTFTVMPKERHELATNCVASQATAFDALVVVISSIENGAFAPGSRHLPESLRQPAACNCWAACLVEYSVGCAAV